MQNEKVKNAVISRAIDPSTPTENLEYALAILTGKRKIDEECPFGFLSDEEACDYCGGISHSTLWTWRKKGLISYQVGGRRLYRQKDIDSYIINGGTSSRLLDGAK